MVMSPIRPRLTPQHGFFCSTPIQRSQNSVFYSSKLLSPIWAEEEISSREKIPQPDRSLSRQDHGTAQKRSSFDKVAATSNFRNVTYDQKAVAYPPSRGRQKQPDTDCREEEKSPLNRRFNKITVECHQEKAGERMRNCSERFWQNLMVDREHTVILDESYKKEAYQKGSKAKTKKEDDTCVSQNMLKRKEEVLVHKVKLQRKGTFDNIKCKVGKKKLEEMRRPQKKRTLQNSIERKKKQQIVQEGSTGSEKSNGNEDQELQTEESFCNVVISQNNKAQPEVTRSPPKKKKTQQDSEERNEKQQVVRENPQRRTLQNSIKRNKKRQIVQESSLRKRLSTDSEKSSGNEDQELQTEESFCNIVIPQNNKAQPEATRRPHKKKTRQNSEERNEEQQVVQENPQRKRLSTNSEEPSGEEEQESVNESPRRKNVLHNKETLQNSMDRNEKQQVVQQRLLRKRSSTDSGKPNTEENPGEASHSSIEKNQQDISKIPQRKGVPQNCGTSKQKEDPQAVGESLQKKHTSHNSINSKGKEGAETVRENHHKKHISPNNIHSEMKEDQRNMRTGSLKELASPNSLGKKDPQALVERQKKKVPQNKIIRSRRKEETISSKKHASQDSVRYEGRNEPLIADKQSQPSEELIKPNNKKTVLQEGHVSKSKRKKVVQGPSRRKVKSQNNSERNTKPRMSNAEKDNIPLPGSSSRGGMSSTSSTSKLKSSYPTYKGVRKRKHFSGETLVKFLTGGRLSMEYNPFQDGQKFIAPSEDGGDLRRSKRTRVKPLDYWRGERCLYKPTNCGLDFFRISSPI